MDRNIKWAFLCSFWGNNAKDAIAWHAENGQIDKIGMVIYEQENCGAADEAKLNGIKHVRMPLKDFDNKRDHQAKMVDILLENGITHIFLLGFEHLIRKQMLDAFPNKIANIHPSLFPSFLATKTAIQDALDYGVKVTGITTHIIDDRFDRGTILCQEPVRIDEGDTFDTLYPKFSSKGLPLIIESMKLMENQN